MLEVHREVERSFSSLLHDLKPQPAPAKEEQSVKPEVTPIEHPLENEPLPKSEVLVGKENIIPKIGKGKLLKITKGAPPSNPGPLKIKIKRKSNYATRQSSNDKKKPLLTRTSSTLNVPTVCLAPQTLLKIE